MKTALKIASGLGAISALSTLASTAYAQGATSTGTATGTATIIQSISVTASTSLGFGTIVKPSSGTSTVVVSTAGSRSFAGGGNAVAANTGGVSAASFLIQGEGGSTISVTVPPNFNMSTGTNTLIVTTTSTTTAGNLSGSIGAQGSFTVGVGGSFPLSSATNSGSYSGNLVVTASYN